MSCVECTNCGGCLQIGQTRWLCAWCDASGHYVQGPDLRNGKRWPVRVTDHPGRAEMRRAWVPAESMTHAERVSEQRGKS
jgi:hypothetical protein